MPKAAKSEAKSIALDPTCAWSQPSKFKTADKLFVRIDADALGLIVGKSS